MDKYMVVCVDNKFKIHIYHNDKYIGYLYERYGEISTVAIDNYNSQYFIHNNCLYKRQCNLSEKLSKRFKKYDILDCYECPFAVVNKYVKDENKKFLIALNEPFICIYECGNYGYLLRNEYALSNAKPVQQFIKRVENRQIIEVSCTICFQKFRFMMNLDPFLIENELI